MTGKTVGYKLSAPKKHHQDGNLQHLATYELTYFPKKLFLKITRVTSPNAILRAMNASLIYKIACWTNGIALIIFLGIEIFWFVEESKRAKDALPLAVTFVLYNLPFFLLGLSMYFQPIPTAWTGVLRLVFLLVCIPINLWLHYHGDNGGNSVGMIIVVFLLGAVPFVVIMEVFIWFYNYGK